MSTSQNSGLDGAGVAVTVAAAGRDGRLRGRPAIMRIRLRPYSSRPWRALVQLVSDLAVIAWVIVWVQAARLVEQAVQQAARPGYALQSGAGGIASNLHNAGKGVAGVPVVGGPLGTPLTSAGGAAGNVADAGHELGDRISGAALPLALAVALVPVVPVVLLWLSMRLRFASRAGACATAARMPGGASLLALRALATRSPRRLAALGPDLVDAWRRDDPDVVRRLAELELRLSGVRRRALPRDTTG
jgi:hypothetical protein